MSLGKGTSGFSPVSIIAMLALLISFSTNPVKQEKNCQKKKEKSYINTFIKL